MFRRILISVLLVSLMGTNTLLTRALRYDQEQGLTPSNFRRVQGGFSYYTAAKTVVFFSEIVPRNLQPDSYRAVPFIELVLGKEWHNVANVFARQEAFIRVGATLFYGCRKNALRVNYWTGDTVPDDPAAFQIWHTVNDVHTAVFLEYVVTPHSRLEFSLKGGVVLAPLLFSSIVQYDKPQGDFVQRYLAAFFVAKDIYYSSGQKFSMKPVQVLGLFGIRLAGEVRKNMRFSCEYTVAMGHARYEDTYFIGVPDAGASAGSIATYNAAAGQSIVWAHKPYLKMHIQYCTFGLSWDF